MTQSLLQRRPGTGIVNFALYRTNRKTLIRLVLRGLEKLVKSLLLLHRLLLGVTEY